MKKWIVLILMFGIVGCSQTDANATNILDDPGVDQLVNTLGYEVQLPTKLPFEPDSTEADIDSGNQQLNIHLRNEDYGVIDVFIVKGPVTYKGAETEEGTTPAGRSVQYRGNEDGHTLRFEQKGIHYQVSSLSFDGQTALKKEQLMEMIDNFE
ncbi:hypothetical protein LCM20_01635 [Halobacillus litoralis]|uniref:hypothetical protein n=1 Tax=Halobacillus litoralis TaxID=45668 RepID=UPI001CD3BCEE|nr:hypothetical protein [Halobacillus litoralis]MCA0969288.1 hypothetical protein [Halobacillus litoralis]